MQKLTQEPFDASDFERISHTTRRDSGLRHEREGASRGDYEALADVDPDVFAANFDREAGDGHGGIHRGFAGGDVVLPAVPGAGDHLALELAFAERSAAMEASVVNGVEGSVDVGDGQGATVDLKFADRARGNFIFSRRTQKRHFWKPPRSNYSKD